MSQTNSPADYIPAAILRAHEEAETEAMASPVEKALRAIPPGYMTPEVALRIVECLSARMLASAWKHPMDDAICRLFDVEGELYSLVQRMQEQ